MHHTCHLFQQPAQSTWSHSPHPERVLRQLLDSLSPVLLGLFVGVLAAVHVQGPGAVVWLDCLLREGELLVVVELVDQLRVGQVC